MRSFVQCLVVLLLAATMSGLAGCGSWLPSTESLAGASTSPVSSSEPMGSVSVLSSVTLGTISGPPQTVSDNLIRMLDGASRRAQIALLNYSGAQGNYRLQGDLKIMRQRGMIKLTYTWQVFDLSGTRVAGKSGSESVAYTPGTDLWSQVPDSTLLRIADEGINAVISRRS